MKSNAAEIAAIEIPPIGAPLAGGFHAGTIWHPTTGIKFALIVAGKEGEIIGEWGNYGTRIEGARSFWDGLSNTNEMALAGSKLAKQIRALRIGSYDDWAIPARDQLEVIYRNLKPTTDKNYCWGADGYNAHSLAHAEVYTPDAPAQTPVEAFQKGGSAAFDPTWYWSSTQYSAITAFYQNFEDGDQDDHDKDTKFRARAVRMIQLGN